MQSIGLTCRGRFVSLYGLKVQRNGSQTQNFPTVWHYFVAHRSFLAFFFKLETQEIRNWHKLVFRSFVFIILFESWKPSRRVMIGQHFPFTETKKNLGISHLKSIELVKELINSKNSTISYFILKFGWFVALKLFQVGFKYLSPITFRILVSLR